jgi:hypothetical protein
MLTPEVAVGHGGFSGGCKHSNFDDPDWVCYDGSHRTYTSNVKIQVTARDSGPGVP